VSESIDTESDIAKALAMRHIAVVGFSDKPARASYYVSVYMANAGYRVIGINPLLIHKRDLPISVVESLSDMPPPIDIVNVFRRSEEVPEIAEAAVRRGAKVLWLQEGIHHPEAAAMARAAGLIVVEDRCLLKEHTASERRAQEG
jgi:predicted CoA-binding protein